MKKITFIVLMVMFRLVIVWSAGPTEGTVRIFTKEGWRFKDSNDSLPPSGGLWLPARIVNRPTVWDRTYISLTNDSVTPWGSLYHQTLPDSAFWIGVANNGWDSLGCCDHDTIWFLSPSFSIPYPQNISRVIIWLACDDKVDRVFFVASGNCSTFAVSCSAECFLDLERYDVTDIVRKKASSLCTYRLAIRVLNVMRGSIGLMCYFSFDYGEPKSYAYYLGSFGFRVISMPFYPIDTTATLSSLFPGIQGAYYYPWTDTLFEWHSLNLNTPIKGAFADTLRTFTIWILSTGWQRTSVTLSGYPVFEQRYLDIWNNNDLWFSTITMRNCDPGQYGYIPFESNSPDDYCDWKIIGDSTWVWVDESDSNGYMARGVTEVRERKGYKTHPCHLFQHWDLPYHLDLIKYRCKFPNLAMGSGSNEFYFYDGLNDYEEEPVLPEILFISDEDIRMLREFDERHANDPVIDTAKIYEYVAWRERMASLPRKDMGDFPPLPDELITQLHRRTQREVLPHELSVSVFPSPFNNSTVVSVLIPNDDYIAICVYDITGAFVNRIFVGNVSTGVHRFVWNGNNSNGSFVSSGIYFIRVSTSGGEYTKTKVMFIR